MKTIFKSFLVWMALLLSLNCFARDTVETYSVQEALTSHMAAKTHVGDSVRFYFGDAPHGKVLETMGIVKSNRKTNAFGKSDREACQWVFLSALRSLRDQALERGGNAVINIHSNYRNKMTSSRTHFTCGSGAVIAGVALSGKVVKLAK